MGKEALILDRSKVGARVDARVHCEEGHRYFICVPSITQRTAMGETSSSTSKPTQILITIFAKKLSVP